MWMPVTVGPYGQSQPSCFDRIKMGFMMGFAVGMAAGALFGTFSCLRIGMRGRELMGGVGKTMMQSGGTFGTFMAIEKNSSRSLGRILAANCMQNTVRASLSSGLKNGQSSRAKSDSPTLNCVYTIKWTLIIQCPRKASGNFKEDSDASEGELASQQAQYIYGQVPSQNSHTS
ncbi:hypothetical protein IHE44_0004443 [Lamprotornis superbus]|uniref:Reactive oxygen species modulator 1 n=1 Tax=Lamprotornis superbus TaxID=245042 RepID=A0A835TPV1_9PASS|nr:hypothetical protein IHE44_0004443 [Lamprotornis superbus]